MENMKVYREKMDRKVRRASRYMKCYERAAEKLITAYCHDMMMDDPGMLFKNWIPDTEQDNFLKYCEKRTGGRYRYIFFTVNFKEEIPLETIIKQTLKCCRKKWIEKYMYCYETRDDQGKGVHLHLKAWIKKGKKPYDCKREVYNTFKHIVGNELHVVPRYSNIDGCFEEYIKGMKKGEEKDNFANDRKWRRLNNLKDIYV